MKDYQIVTTYGGQTLFTRKRYKEFRRLRKQCKVSIAAVSVISGVPEADIEHYEMGRMYYEGSSVINRLFEVLEWLRQFSLN